VAAATTTQALMRTTTSGRSARRSIRPPRVGASLPWPAPRGSGYPLQPMREAPASTPAPRAAHGVSVCQSPGAAPTRRGGQPLRRA
jgi:hypothetical protein